MGKVATSLRQVEKKIEICVQMGKDKSHHLLSQEFYFLDAVHSRCQGFKTLTLWVWHPTLNELVNLATMECETESTKVIQLFWTYLNEVKEKTFYSDHSI